MTMQTLVRADALALIDDAEGDAAALRTLAAAWDLAGHWNDSAVWDADRLRQHVNDCCDADSDDTGLPDPDDVAERIADGTVPDSGQVAAFPGWRAFALALWAFTSEDFRNEEDDPYSFATGCLLSQNGVFVVTDRPDGRIDVENVG
jgi:hypothetical protein